MTEDNKNDHIHKALFTSLVAMLASSAMQQLGKLVNPMTNQTEVNLEGAQVSIDMLEMLQKKTEGNLDEDEDRMLTDALSSLHMNYVQTSQAAPAEETGEEQPATETGDQAPEQDLETPEGDPKDPKYHKSYGD